MGMTTRNKGLLSRIRAQLKYMVYGSGNGTPWSWDITMPDFRYGTTVDYRQRAGELTENAIVMACVRWIMTNFAMPTRVMRKTAGGTKDTERPDHPLAKLLTTPNQYYSGELLMRSTALSLALANNAYWLVWPNRMGMPVELWYEPHHTIRVLYPSPVNNAGQYDPNTPFITGYEIFREGRWYPVDKENVIHFRDSIDPRNPRMGLFVLGAALREVFTDNEAAAYTAAILQNMGVPGMIVSPSGDARIDDPHGLKRHLMAAMQGDHRGEPIVLSDPASVNIPAFNPEQMQIKSARDIPEERIAALLGPGLVIAAGLGAGLERSTFHNVGEAVASAFRNNIMPTHRIVAGQINTQLLSRMGNPDNEYLEFDLTEVPELQEDRAARAGRVNDAIKVGVPIYVNEAREALGLPPIDDMKDAFVKAPVAPPQLPPGQQQQGQDNQMPMDMQPGQQQQQEGNQQPGKTPPSKVLVLNGNGHSDN